MELPRGQLLNKKGKLPKEVRLSVAYHGIFGYPLRIGELQRWLAGKKVRNNKLRMGDIQTKNGFIFTRGQSENVYKRLMNEKFSKPKLKIAKKASKLLKTIPSIKMVAVTGSLAMANAREDSDIDLMIVTSKGTLWTTRLLSYLLLWLGGFKVRRKGESYEKDKLCLNIWVDETNLSWARKNVFIAHEIFQTLPLIDKNGLYEKFVADNRWVFDYWPNAKRKTKTNKEKDFGVLILPFLLIEPLAFWVQYLRMRNKVTRELITPSKALFHPVDWSRVVKSSGF